MADSTTSGYNRMLDNVGKFSGVGNFREWNSTLRQGIILYVPELLPILDGDARPSGPSSTPAATAAWDKANGRMYSLLFFTTSGSAQLTVRAHEGGGTRRMGDGAAAWKALNERFDAHNQEARRACHNELFNLRHLAGGDPIDFFTKGFDLKGRLKLLGEDVSENVFLDVMLTGLTKAPEFKFIREMHYRDEFTTVDKLQQTATRFYIDQRARNASGPVVSGRGAAMAASSTDQCHQCKEYGHFQRDCPKRAQKRPTGKKHWKKGMKGGGGGGQQKWCSYHNTTNHADSECNKQKELKELKGLAANIAWLKSAAQATPSLGSAHVAQASQPEPTTFGFSFNALGASLPEVGSSPAASGTPSVASNAQPAASSSASSETPTKSHHLPQGLFGAFMATPADLSQEPFRSDGSSLLMLVDSGASDNYLDPALTPGLRAYMRDVEDLRVPHTIVAAGQHLLHGVATGTISGTVTDDGGNDLPVSFRAILVPGLGTNLFSVSEAMLKGVATVFHPEKPRLESEDVTVPMQNLGEAAATGKLMYTIRLKLGGGTGGQQVPGCAPAGLALRSESADLWHRRMGHLNRKSMDVLRKQLENGVDYAGDVQDCGPCPLGKSAQQPHPKQATYNVQRPFQIVLVDTLGPFSPPALGNFRYATKFVDQQTKWKEVILMKDKTCSTDSLALFNKGTVVPTGERIQCVRGDQGTEFTSGVFREYCLDHGIKLEFASPNTPQQIGANERAGRTLLNIVRCLLADSNLPKFLWGELLHTAVYLSNRSPHAALNNGTPYKALYGKDAFLGNLRVIGCRAFVHEETFTKKLESRAWEGRLVGYSTTSKSYRIYNSQSHRVRESRNVVFIETPRLPPADDADFDSGEFNYDDHDDMVRDVRNHTFNHSIDSLSPDHAVGEPPVMELLHQIRETTARDLHLAESSSSDGGVPEPSGNGPGGVASPAPTTSGAASGPPASRGGRGARGGSSRGGTARGGITTRSGRGYGGGRGSSGERGAATAPTRPTTRSSSSQPSTTQSAPRQPNAQTISELRRLSYAFTVKGEFPDVAHRDGSFGSTEYAYATGTSQPGVPRTIKEARAMPDAGMWNAAAEREMASLKERNVFKLVPRSSVPPGRKRINSKWVFKRKADGTYKGRVVAQGWNQVPGVDCGSTFAPVCKLPSIRVTLCISVEFGWKVHQMDISTAFLYAGLQEKVFVEQAPGFEVRDKDGGELVMQLEKSLYGLAQSPGNWFRTIDPVLVEIGFVPLKSDTCVYVYEQDGAKIILTLYVDDLLLTGNNEDAISKVKSQLKQRFKMTDMGEASLVLGIEIRRNLQLGTLTISQKEYTKSVLKKFGFSDCKSTNTPGYGPELSNKQPEDTVLSAEDTQTYQSIVGCLIYLTNLRYDIMYATGQLTRAMAKPSQVHLVAAKRILRYLAGTTDFSITYKKGGFKLVIFSDSNWANNPDNGKSTSCYVTMLANAPMSSRSGLQSLTAMSTMEAELVASALAMKEAVFCSNLLTELGFGKEFAKVPLYCDNTATLHALGNRSHSSRTKHIALRYFYIRELVSEGRISIHYIRSNDNIADIGTKHLNQHQFRHLLSLIENFNVMDFINKTTN